MLPVRVGAYAIATEAVAAWGHYLKAKNLPDAPCTRY